MSHLFTPFKLGNITLANRIVIPPMCQYSAIDGCATDWHTIHLGNLALSGAGLLIIEATAVEPRGRISYQDLGLWDDTTEHALAQVISSVKNHSDMPLAIQLAHAGRKASTNLPWLGGKALSPDHEHGWQTVAPSAIAFDEHAFTPHELTEHEITQIVESFVQAAIRAARIGINIIEIHAAHGYLLHEFLSPLANQRQDAYGGSLENRMRLLMDIFNKMRQAVSDDVVIGVRISATDWVDGGWDLTQSIELSKALQAAGCQFIHVSSGGLSPKQQLKPYPNYQVAFAQAIKESVSMPVIAVGLITEAVQAEAIVATQQADLIAIGRGILFNPRWPWHAAMALGDTVTVANQFLRSAPVTHSSLFKK